MAYTNIKDPSEYFQIALYTGNGSSISVTNDGNSDLQPDWVWIKNRAAYHHQVYDTNRGVHKKILTSNTNVESTDTTALTAFNTDGFSTGANIGVNQNNVAHVAWQWKANGGTTTSVSASGTGSGCINACTYQANTTAGFSIITYTGRDDQLNNAHESKLTHGLGVAPKAFLCRRRDATDDWFYMGGDQATTRQGWYNGFLSLNDMDAVNGNHYVSNTQPDSTHIYLGNEKVNIASATYVGYAFAEVQGYSKFGKYIGNGNVNGPFVYTGFKPAFIMVKSTDATGSWRMWDSARNPGNLADNTVHADKNTAENAHGSDEADILSNGFKARNTGSWHNASGVSYIYIAFAENPFVAGGVPTTAR